MAAVPVPANSTCRCNTTPQMRPTQAWPSQDNLAVSKALLAKYPELREAFGAVIARAADTEGHAYSTLTPMKDVK